MNVRLTVSRRDQPGPSQEPRTEVFDLDKISLGRDPGCHVVLSLQAVSRSHACITRDGDICYIEDSGSSFGTQVNNEPLSPHEKRRLYNGDIIAIAQFDLSFETIVQVSQTGPHGPPKLVIVSEKPYLRIMNGPEEGTRIEIEEGREYVVGRTPEAQVLLKTDLVSRKHAKLRRDLGGTHVEDLGSRNGIRLNRKPVSIATLNDGDELEIGGIKMLYIDLDNPKVDRSLIGPPPPNTNGKTPSLLGTLISVPPVPPPPIEPSPPLESEDDAPQEALNNLEPSPEKIPPPPSLKGKQAVVLLVIGGGVALIALVFLILVFAGA